MINRDEKIANEIIKPKDELIQELSKQEKVLNESEKYTKERDTILANNE